MTNVEPLYNEYTAAERLITTPEIIRELIDGGKLRSVAVGNGKKCRPRCIIIRESWLMEWLEQTSLTGPTGDR